MVDRASIIEEINLLIDGEALARLLEYHPDKIQINGTTLKCFCPVHHELAFRSLILNLKAKTYKCTMKRCEAFEGGSFVQLWSLYHDLELIEAALDLAERLKLPVDVETLRRLGITYAEKAQTELESGDPAAARAAIEQALAFDPRNLKLRLLSAQIWLAAGEPSRALEEQRAVFDACLEEGDLKSAGTLLNQLLASQPDSLPLLEDRLRLARRQANKKPEALTQALLALGDARQQAGNLPEALAALEEASGLSPADDALLVRLADLYEQTGRPEPLAGTLERLTSLYEGAQRMPELLAVLERRMVLCPQDLTLRERMAAILEREGRADEARACWLLIAGIYAEHGHYAEAGQVIGRLLESVPEDMDLLERQAQLLAKAGDGDGAISVYRRLAGLAAQAGLGERVGDYYDLARMLDPQDLRLRREQAEWRLSTDNLDAGLNDLFALADLCFEQAELAEGMVVLERIAALAPTDLDKRLRIGRCLERNGLSDEAYDCYCGLARDFLRQQLFDAAQAICEEARRLRPLDAQTLELRIESHLALRQRSEAIEACREVARALVATDDRAGAEAALLRGIHIDRSETQIKTDLARLYEAWGRTEQAAQLWIEMSLFHRMRETFSSSNQAVHEALRLDPGNREARIMLAEGLEGSGQGQKALEIREALAQELLAENPADPEALRHFRQALKLAPASLALLRQVATLTLDLEGTEAARPVFEQWLSALHGEADKDEALDAYRLAIAHYPDELTWRGQLAGFLLEAGEQAEAAQHLEILLNEDKQCIEDDGRRHALLDQLVALVPERLDLRTELAHSFARQGRLREALDAFQWLSEHYLGAGDLDAALDMLAEALALDPGHEQLLARSAELLEQVGRTDEAIPLYERLAEIRRRQTDVTLNIPILEKLLAFDPARLDLRAELAELYEVEGDLDSAIEQHYALAQARAAQSGGTDEAVALCLRIRTLAPEFIPARELLVESWLTQGSVSEAKGELDRLGDLALTAGKLERAEECFKRVQELDPDDIGSSERLGKLYEAHGRLDEAAEAFQRVLEIYERLSESARAIGVLQKLKQLRPDDLDLRGHLARLLLEQGGERREAADEWHDLIALALTHGELAVADAALDEAAPVFKQNWSWRGRIARTLAEAGQTERAGREWQALAGDAGEAREFAVVREATDEGLKLAPDQTQLRELRIEANRRLSDYESAARDLREMAGRLAEQKELARAEQYLNEALELQPRSTELLAMLGDVQAAAGRTAEACDTHRRLAEFHRQEGNHAAAIEQARRLTELEPGEMEPQDYLAALLLEAGRTDEAIALWKELAEGCAAAGDIPAALTRFTRILELLPGDIGILRRLADLTYEEGGMLQAMGHYDRLIDVLHAAGDADATEYEYLRILDLEPGHLQLKERLADFLREQGRKDEARALLLEIVAAYRDEQEQTGDALRVLRHLKALDRDSLEVRRQEAELLEKLEQSGEAAQAWRQMALAHQRAGEEEQAAEALAHAAELDGEQAPAQLEAAEIFEAMGRTDEATQYLLRAIEIHDRHERLDQCVPILERAIRMNPTRLDLSDALARIHERLGQLDRAARQWLELGAAYEQSGQPAEARQVYAHLRALVPEQLECRRRLVDLCAQTGDRAGALGELRELARLAEAAGKPEDAADYLMRLLEMEPQDEASVRALAAIWRGLGWVDELYETLSTLERICCATAQYDEALATLEELKSLRPDEPELLDRAIELLIRTGQTEEAARQGLALVQTYFSRGDDHHALETLRRIVEIDPGNIERRIALARLVHDSGRDSVAQQEFFLSASKLFGEDAWEGCLRVCQAGLELFADDVRLRDLMGRVLVKLGRQSEAIEVQLQLAALHDERGEDAKARRVYELILEAQPDNQATLEAMVAWALRHDKTSLAVDHLLRLAETHYLGGALEQAIEAMERIQTLDPQRLDLKARLAEIYMEAGDEAVALTTWLAAGRGMAASARHEAAIEIFERLLAMRPDDQEILASLTTAYGAAGRVEQHQRHALQLADLLVGSGQAGQAVALFEELVGRYPTDPQAWERLTGLYEQTENLEGAVQAHWRLYEIHRSSRRLDQARKSLEAALALQPGDMDMLEALGELCLSLGRRPQGVEHLAQAALLMEQAGQHERVRDLAARILKLDPLNLAVRRQYARMLELTGREAEALEEYKQVARGYAEARLNEPALGILDHVLTLAPALADERELYARLLNREGRAEESIQQYLHLIETLDPNDDPRRAIKYCRQILNEQPDHPAAHVCLCGVYERSEKLRQAFKECEWLADYYLTHEESEQAELYIQKGLAWFPEEPGMRTRLVDLLLAQERPSEAARQLAELARLAEFRADTRTTAWAMAKACEIEPDNLDNQQRLADYQERAGNTAGARQTRLGMIRLMLAQGKMDEARELAERLVESAAESATLRQQIAAMFEEAGLPEVAAYHFHQLARQALAELEFEEARQLAQQALRLKPRHVGAREALIEAMLALRENKEAVEQYEYLYEIYFEADEWDAALRTLLAIIDIIPSAPEPRAKLIQLYGRMRREEAMIDQLRRLVEIHVNANDFKAAMACLRNLMDQRPEDTRARVRYIDLFSQFGDESELVGDYLQLARIFARKGSVVEATRAYEKVMAIQPEDPACREEFVQFLFEQGQVSRGIDETRVLADLYEQAQQVNAAGRVLDRALNYAPQELELRQRLAGIYLRTNRRGQAMETYRTLARHYEQAGNPMQLIEVIEQIVQIDELNVEYRQRLADLYQERGIHDKALEQFELLAEQYIERHLYDLAEHEYRRMLEIRPEDIEIWQHMVQIHLQIGSAREIVPDFMMLAGLLEAQGRLKDAVGIYRRILECEPDNLEILTRYIDGYMQIGLEQDLIDDYLHLADLRARHGEVAEASRIYRHLLELSPDNPLVAERMSVNQQLAQAAEGRGGKSATATPASGTNGRSLNGESAPGVPMLAKVIRNYENVLRLNPNNPSARAKLAELLEQTGDLAQADIEWAQASESYFVKGDLDRCIEISEHYLTRHPDDARVRERLSRALVQRDSLRVIDGALAGDKFDID